jgi:hypothetical protein
VKKRENEKIREEYNWKGELIKVAPKGVMIEAIYSKGAKKKRKSNLAEDGRKVFLSLFSVFLFRIILRRVKQTNSYASDRHAPGRECDGCTEYGWAEVVGLTTDKAQTEVSTLIRGRID